MDWMVGLLVVDFKSQTHGVSTPPATPEKPSE